MIIMNIAALRFLGFMNIRVNRMSRLILAFGSTIISSPAIVQNHTTAFFAVILNPREFIGSGFSEYSTIFYNLSDIRRY